MQPPNSEISTTTNGGHYKELGLKKYPDWYYQKKVTIQKVVSREVFWHVFCQNPETYKAKCHHRR